MLVTDGSQSQQQEGCMLALHFLHASLSVVCGFVWLASSAPYCPRGSTSGIEDSSAGLFLLEALGKRISRPV